MGPVTFVLGGKERNLRYTMESCEAIDKAGGRERSVLQDGLWDEQATPGGVSLLLWGALLPDWPEVTLEEVKRLLSPGRMFEAIEACTKAWLLDMPPPREEPEANPPEAPTESP